VFSAQTSELSAESTLDARFIHRQQQVLLQQQRQLLQQQQQLAARQQQMTAAAAPRRPATPSDAGLSSATSLSAGQSLIDFNILPTV